MPQKAPDAMLLCVVIAIVFFFLLCWWYHSRTRVDRTARNGKENWFVKIENKTNVHLSIEFFTPWANNPKSYQTRLRVPSNTSETISERVPPEILKTFCISDVTVKLTSSDRHVVLRLPGPFCTASNYFLLSGRWADIKISHASPIP